METNNFAGGNLTGVLGVFLWAALVFLVVALAMYVLQSIAFQKALRKLGYARPWMAWIPFVCHYALADVVKDADGTTMVLGAKLPSMVFNFWWVLLFVFNFLPAAGGVISCIWQTICLGTCFQKIFAKLEGKNEKDTAFLGYVSGMLPVVGAIKILMGK